MAGGITTPKFVAAVSNAGAIGSFGFAYSLDEFIDNELIKVRQLTKNPVNANFFIFPEQHIVSKKIFDAAVKSLNQLPINFDLRHACPEPPYTPSIYDQLEPIWIHRPECLTFHFGAPEKTIIDKAKSLGIIVGVTVTNLLEAETVLKSEADFLIAQGIEAGGHRGSFSDTIFDSRLPTLDLLKLLLRNFELPVVSTGGIMDGFVIRKHLDLGAAGVQMGTAFLCCDEAGTNSTYRKYILEKNDRKTELTKGFSGRWARSIQNEFTEQIKNRDVMPFPLQNILTSKLRTLATKTENGEYQSLWAGENFRKARALSVKDLVTELISEIRA